MKIAIGNKFSRRDFLKSSCCLGTILMLQPKEAKAWLPVIVFIGRIIARSAIKKIGQYIVRSSVARTVTSRTISTVAKTGILASTFISEVEAKVADLTEDEIRQIAKRMNYPDDKYDIWLRDEPSSSNELSYHITNNKNNKIDKIIRVVVLNENNEVEDSFVSKIIVNANSTIKKKISFDVSNTKYTGAKKIVFLDENNKPEVNTKPLSVIIEDYENIKKVLI